MSVRSDLDRAYEKKVVQLTEAATVKTVIDIDRELVEQTPVDTGRARSNWLPSIGTPRNDVVGIDGAPDTTAVMANYKLGDTAFIANNLPYIQRLNDGYSSQQATPSWVDATVLKYSNKLKQTIAGVKRGL